MAVRLQAATVRDSASYRFSRAAASGPIDPPQECNPLLAAPSRTLLSLALPHADGAAQKKEPRPASTVPCRPPGLIRHPARRALVSQVSVFEGADAGGGRPHYSVGATSLIQAARSGPRSSRSRAS